MQTNSQTPRYEWQHRKDNNDKMGVYVKGVDMPKCCGECWALDDDGDYPRCRITNEQRGYTFKISEKVMDKCPLIEGDI